MSLIERDKIAVRQVDRQEPNKKKLAVKVGTEGTIVSPFDANKKQRRQRVQRRRDYTRRSADRAGKANRSMLGFEPLTENGDQPARP